MTHKEVEDYILSLPNATLTYPFGAGVAVYKVKGKMFALIQEGKSPVNLSLKCDPELSKLLRDRYDEVQAGYHLNKKHWNTIVLSGQLNQGEIEDLIRHSYELVTGQDSSKTS